MSAFVKVTINSLEMNALDLDRRGDCLLGRPWIITIGMYYTFTVWHVQETYRPGVFRALRVGEYQSFKNAMKSIGKEV